MKHIGASCNKTIKNNSDCDDVAGSWLVKTVTQDSTMSPRRERSVAAISRNQRYTSRRLVREDISTECRQKESEESEARTRRTTSVTEGDVGRRKRSDGHRTVVEQRRCYFRMNVVEGRLVESKIKGENGEKRRRRRERRRGDIGSGR